VPVGLKIGPHAPLSSRCDAGTPYIAKCSPEPSLRQAKYSVIQKVTAIFLVFFFCIANTVRTQNELVLVCITCMQIATVGTVGTLLEHHDSCLTDSERPEITAL